MLVDGMPCYTIRSKERVDYRFDLLYFDARQYQLRRWDTFYTDQGPDPVVSRTRRYRNLSTAPLPADTWTLPPGATLALTDAPVNESEPSLERDESGDLILESMNSTDEHKWRRRLAAARREWYGEEAFASDHDPLPPEVAVAIERPRTPVELPPITPEELLERAQRTLIETENLSFEMEVVAPPSTIVRAEARMAPDRLRVELYLRDIRVEWFAEEQCTNDLLIVGRRAHEIRYHCFKNDRLDADYRSPYPGGTRSTVLVEEIEDYAHLTGSVLATWVGPHARRPTLELPALLSGGTMLPSVLVENTPCYVIRSPQHGDWRFDELYFDAESFHLIRWDTFNLDAPIGTKRSEGNDLDAPIGTKRSEGNDTDGPTKPKPSGGAITNGETTPAESNEAAPESTNASHDGGAPEPQSDGALVKNPQEPELAFSRRFRKIDTSPLPEETWTQPEEADARKKPE